MPPSWVLASYQLTPMLLSKANEFLLQLSLSAFVKRALITVRSIQRTYRAVYAWFVCEINQLIAEQRDSQEH